jgi:UDP-N-acetyl-D-mannosaminuronic acid transferase (WecB/TagA/CpsF family)
MENIFINKKVPSLSIVSLSAGFFWKNLNKHYVRDAHTYRVYIIFK